MEDQLIETWNINSRINTYLLDMIPEKDMGSCLGGKGRDVSALFCHIHNVRLMWLKSAAPALLEGLEKLDSKLLTERAELRSALEASSFAVEAMLRRGIAEDRIKGFKPHPMAFVGYLISHESHHRGQIEWALKSSGNPLSDKASFGLWEWGTR